ncbi:MAG: HAD family phosphatase [Solobacterium sp.]|nr:HAD family phosphatase [Solobacterium sp.]
MKDIRIIAVDIDNTIIPAGEPRMSERLRTDFHKAIEKGMHVLINTGRHFTFLQPSLFEDLPMDMISTINGACLSDRDGKVLMKKEMSEETMNKLIRYSDEHRIGLGFKFEDHIVTYANYDRFIAGYLDQDSHMKKFIIRDDEQRTHHLRHGYPLGTFMIAEQGEMTGLMNNSPELGFGWSYRHGYDVFSKSVNKATAVEAVLELTGLTWDNVIAFGDAGNDAPFVEKAGISVAMGNSKDDLKKVAMYTAPSCRDDGVAVMLEELHII